MSIKPQRTTHGYFAQIKVLRNSGAFAARKDFLFSHLRHSHWLTHKQLIKNKTNGTSQYDNNSRPSRGVFVEWEEYATQ